VGIGRNGVGVSVAKPWYATSVWAFQRDICCLRSLTGVQLLILDDRGLEPLDAGARRDLYEILEDRYGIRAPEGRAEV
jgi:hypothetical protein